MAWQFAAEDATVLAAGFGELAAQLGVPGPGRYPGPGGVGARGAGRVPGAVAADLRQRGRTWPRWRRSCLPAGPGRVLITSQNPNWPGQALEVPVLAPGRRSGFPGQPHGRSGPAGSPRPGRRAGRAAAGAGAGSRVHAGHRGHPSRVPGLVPAAAGRDAGPRRAHRIRQDGGEHLGAGVRPPAADRAGRGRPAAAAGVLRARGDPAAPAAATPPGPGRAARRRGGPGAGAAAGGPAGGRRRGRGAAPVFADQPWPAAGQCRCTGWCRPSPPIRCPRSWPRSGGRLLPP